MEASRAPRSGAVAAVRSKDRLAAAVLVLGALGGVFLVVAELSTIVSVDVLTAGTCEELADPASRDACSTSGIEQHGGALILLGLLAIAMALGAGRRGSRPAAAALLGIAAVTLAFILLRDLPKMDESGLVGLRYEEAEVSPGPGLYLEMLGAGLCALAGAMRLSRSR
jgi:hypothetical protein